ncbi:MAG: hypothetical protein JNM34_10800 [Chthonomonadaceae bacterium]|nr:hypothetical protein [Chthonomonadaceae bacterium]
MIKKLVWPALVAGLVMGCGSPDVTGASVDDAMKERRDKAVALDKAEGVKKDDHSAELSQDPQYGGK